MGSEKSPVMMNRMYRGPVQKYRSYLVWLCAPALARLFFEKGALILEKNGVVFLMVPDNPAT